MHIPNDNDNDKQVEFFYDLDCYQYKQFNLGVAFDSFVESRLFCEFIWTKDFLSYGMRNFLIGFITKDEKINQLPFHQVAAYYREISDSIPSMSEHEIAIHIPYFWRFLADKPEKFRVSFTQLVNKEVEQYLISIFQMYFLGKNRQGFDFLSRRYQKEVQENIQALI